MLVFFIDLYKLTLSPLLRLLFGDGCRFSPTCSEYTKQAILKFGVTRGVGLGVKRVIKCNPLSHGYLDPVPNN